MEEAAITEIERRAEELLGAVPEWIWDDETAPVPVEDIADSYCNLLVRDVEDMSTAPGCPPLAEGQSISGLLLPGLGQIWVNAEEARQWPPRRRFTIGHELGHWMLHRDEQASLFCRHGQVDPPQGNGSADGGAEQAPKTDARPPLDPREEEANFFAAALLMPAPLIRSHYERLEGDFEKLCSTFRCSGAAMGRRLHQVID